MSEQVIPGNDKILMLTDDEWWELFDKAAHRYLNMSGEEFVRKWNAGDFDGVDTTEVMQVYMLIPSEDGK